MKKLRFRDFLTKRLLVWLAVGILVTAITAGATVLVCQFSFELLAINNTNEAVIRIEKSISKESAFANLALHFDSGSNVCIFFDAAAVIVDSETEEVYLDSERNGVAVINKKTSPTGEALYLLNKSVPFTQKLAEYSPKEYLYMDIESIYADENGFYPGVTTIGTLKNEWDMTPENLEIYDFTPENTSEFKEYTNGTFEFAFGTHPNSKALKIVRTADKSIETDMFDFYNTRGVTIDGKEYMIRAFYSLNFWDVAGKYLLIGGILLIIICIGIAFLTANNKYKKYCTQYEIDEYRRNMTNALAHDLKSPLTAIYGYAENLRNNVHGEKKDYYADAVLENVRYMNEIITSTLELNKLELGNSNLIKEKIDMSVLCNELYSKYHPQAESRNVSFKISGYSVIQADRKLISQAVENLISNAVKYTSDGGEISIIADTKTFTVSNNCDKNITGRNFENHFEKADTSRSNRKGSGIGLTIVKNIAALHKFGFETKAENGLFTAKITF